MSSFKTKNARNGECIAEFQLIVPGKKFASEILRPRLYETAQFLDLTWSCESKSVSDCFIYDIKIKGSEENIELFEKFIEDILNLEEEFMH